MVCLGRIAAKRLIDPEYRITRQHGQWVEKNGVWMTAIYHPSALLRDVGKRPETFDDLIAIREKIRLFARCIVNTGTTLAPDRIILCGSLFKGENIREELIGACQEYDPAYSSKRIVYTSLSKKEGYIGPLAVFAEELLISGGMSAIH